MRCGALSNAAGFCIFFSPLVKDQVRGIFQEPIWIPTTVSLWLRQLQPSRNKLCLSRNCSFQLQLSLHVVKPGVGATACEPCLIIPVLLHILPHVTPRDQMGGKITVVLVCPKGRGCQTWHPGTERGIKNGVSPQICCFQDLGRC